MSAIKRLKRDVSKELAWFLERMHPELFGKRIRPWKVGIHKDIFERYQLVIRELVQKRHPGMDDEDAERIGIRVIEAVLHRLSSHPRYSFAVLCHDFRYDLDGNKCGEITEADKTFHRQRIKGRKKAQEFARDGMSSKLFIICELTIKALKNERGELKWKDSAGSAGIAESRQHKAFCFP